MLAAREYRDLSPSFDFHEESGEIVRRGAGLVHRPGLHLQALASEADRMPPDMTAKPVPEADLLPRIAEAMGLPPDIPPDQLVGMPERIMNILRKVIERPDDSAPQLAAELAHRSLTAVPPDPAQDVPVATVRAMLAEGNRTFASATAASAEEKLADALRRGYLSPAMKGWATALCRSDEASFDAFVSSTVPAFASVMQSFDHMRRPPSRDDRAATVSAEAEAIAAQLGRKPGQLLD